MGNSRRKEIASFIHKLSDSTTCFLLKRVNPSHGRQLNDIKGHNLNAAIPFLLLDAVGGGTAAIDVAPIASPSSVTYDASNNHVYVTNEGSDCVSVISGSTGAVITTVEVGAAPDAI